MATLYLFFLFIFTILCNPHKINSSACSLDFSKFPYEALGECLDTPKNPPPSLTMESCCRSALFSLLQAMAIRSNRSWSIFLDPDEAQACFTTFQSLHNRTNLSQCELQNFISSPAANPCSNDIESIKNTLGVDRYNDFRSNCSALSTPDHGDDACFDCLVPYRQSLKALKESEATNGKGCAEALLISLASADIESPQWVHGTFSCLWDEIGCFSITKGRKRGKKEQLYIRRYNDGFMMGSKKLIAIVIVAVVLVILAPILYKITRRNLQEASDKEIENLSVIVLKKTLEDETSVPLNCSDLYLFSQDEVAKATNGFDGSNLMGEGNLGKTYVGIMPSGMRAAIKRIKKEVEIYDVIDQIFKKSKIRHPNLVSILGYCDKGDPCLVYEYCVNGDLESWILGERRKPILSWDQRVLICIGIARGLCILKRKLKEESVLETMANDVFCFGVVLLQILAGRKPKLLVNEARDAVLRWGNFSGMADPLLRGAFASTEFRDVLAVAVLCTAPNEFERPNIREVLHKLEKHT